MEFERSNTFIGLVETTSGFSHTEMIVVDMDNVEKANRASNMVCGFKQIYGRTKNGDVYEFIKAGKWAKRDLRRMKEMGVVELVCHWCFAPSWFQIPQGVVKVSKSFECGKETKERFDQYAKALLGI